MSLKANTMVVIVMNFIEQLKEKNQELYERTGRAFD